MWKLKFKSYCIYPLHCCLAWKLPKKPLLGRNWSCDHPSVFWASYKASLPSLTQIETIDIGHKSLPIIIGPYLLSNCDSAKVLFYNVVSYSIFTGNNVEIFLKPGEMALYESAVVPHGRQFPFNGEFYDNLFVHYTLEDENNIYINWIQLIFAI